MLDKPVRMRYEVLVDDRNPMTSSSPKGTNAEKFVILAEKRVQKALGAIESIGKLSNRSNYTYSDEQVKVIKAALTSCVNNVMARFSSVTSSSTEFRLK